MSTRMKLWSLVALIAAVSLLGVTAVMAAGTPGTGPDNAMAPAGGPVQLAPGQQQWYAFNSRQAPSGAGDAQIMVRLATNPQDSASFSVWTKDKALAMLAGDTNAVPVGKGTVNVKTESDGTKTPRFNGDQVWISSSRAAEKYYVVVQSHAATPSTYTLSIPGNYVSFPMAPATSQPAVAPSQPAAAASRPAAVVSSSPLPTPVVKPAASPTSHAVASTPNGPSNPYSINGAAYQLGVGQQHWYTFQSPGRDASGNQVLLSLELQANPAGSATFSIWDNRGLKLAATGDPNARPVGSGTLHPVTRDGITVDRFGGNLQWSGTLVDAGTYYVQVQQNGPAPSTYTLQMTQR